MTRTRRECARSEYWRQHARRILLLASLLLSPGLALAQSAPPTEATPTFTRHDLWLGAAVTAGVMAIGASDRWVDGEVKGAGGSSGQHLADFAQPMGTATVIAPMVLLGVVAGPVLGRPEITHASIRIGAGVCVSAVACEALKYGFGRARPFQTPGDPDEFHPFSGFDSFPSGHTTVAFAAAAGLSRELHAAWVPWVAYPLAGLVGWSRVHDGFHWPSDVVAGAALGVWSAEKTEDFFARRQGLATRVSAVVSGDRRDPELGVAFAF